MQSKTRIIVFSVKDWILKFSHTMAISEFWCLGRHLATKVFSLLLHTNKFRKTGTLVFRTKLCYMSSCCTSPFNKGQTILWTWQICGSNYFYHPQFRPVITQTLSPNRASPDIPESLSGDLNDLAGAGYHDPLRWHHEF